MKNFLIIVLLFLGTTIYSQNLVKNGSFEEYTELPYEGSHMKFCKNWENMINNTPDYFHVNFDHSKTISSHVIFGNFFKKYEKTDCSIPKNQNGFQQARTGSAYAGFISREDYREILSTKLSQSLIKNHYYKLAFYVSLSDSRIYATNNIGAYFSTKKLFWKDKDEFKVNSQVRNTDKKILNS